MGARFIPACWSRPAGLQEHWWRREGHVLHLEDLGTLLDGHPERLVVGTGAYGGMRPDRINELFRLGAAGWAGALHYVLARGLAPPGRLDEPLRSSLRPPGAAA